MKTIKVSVIVPAFEAEAYLAACIDSLLAQTLPEIEIIVINDGSSDQTGRIIDEYVRKESRIKGFHQSHAGLSAARNAGLSVVKGQYVTFVDSDDWLSKDACWLLYLRAMAFDADMVLGTMQRYALDGTLSRIGNNSRAFSSGVALDGKSCFVKLLKSGSYTPMVCGNLYKRSFLDTNQLRFEGLIHEDERFSPFALYHAERVIDLKENLYFYRQHEMSMTHAYDFRRGMNALANIGKACSDFVQTAITDQTNSEVHYAILWQSVSLYIRALQVYERFLQQSQPEEAPEINVLSLTDCKRHFSDENQEWLDDIYSRLSAEQEKITFLHKCQPDKKQLFIFSRESTAAKYGIGTYVQQLIPCFEHSEWSISIVNLYSNAKEYTLTAKDGITYHEIPFSFSPETKNGVSQIESRYLKSVFFLLAPHIRYRQVYCHFNFTNVYELAMLFKQKLNSINVLTVHFTQWSFDLLGDRAKMERIIQHPQSIQEESIKRTFEDEKRFMADCCDRIVCIAQHSYQMLLQLYKLPESKLVQIPNGAEDKYIERSKADLLQLRKKYLFSEHENLVIFAGRLDLVKGIKELLKAFSSLQEEIPSVRLIIVGDGDFKTALQLANPCWSKIVFTGFVDKAHLYELFAISDIGVTPSLHEEFGYVAVEMLMNRLPLIASDSTGLKEITDNGKYGKLVHWENTASNVCNLKKALKEWLTQPVYRESFGALGRQRFETTYSNSVFAAKIKQLYGSNQLIGRAL